MKKVQNCSQWNCLSLSHTFLPSPLPFSLLHWSSLGTKTWKVLNKLNWIWEGRRRNTINHCQSEHPQSIMHELTFTNSSSMRQFAPSSLLEPSRNCQNECGCSRPNPHLPTFLYPFLQFDHPQPFLLYVFLLQKMSLIWVNILTSPRPFSLIYQP